MSDPNKKFQYALNLGFAGIAGQVGFVALLIVAVALGAGWWVDSLLHVRPLFMILFLIGSVPITIFIMIRLALGAVSKIKPVLPPRETTEQIKKEEDSSE
ncbi:MAG: AtpZ/AtpI family protein [Chloroflexi bacterium]|nr:AtpZ/AtpI family protein [Chloroflexota bacterium]MBI5054530.1 AtpZ/AtpI family protein [Chloroflexota bacterium]MBI5349293.1 AtpZ/AtpI family protein [Chloroflexota bacterium]